MALLSKIKEFFAPETKQEAIRINIVPTTYSPCTSPKWTPWITAEDDDGYFCYRTNGKKTIVKKNGIKSESTCHKNDTFDLENGVNLALARTNLKLAKAELDNLLNSLR